MENYPGNSRQTKPPVAQEPKKVEKVISGSVVRRKKPLGRRFTEMFIGGSDSGTVWGYVFYDVLIPAAKDMVFEAASQGLERKLFGEVRGRSRSRSSSSYTNYSKMSQIGPIGMPRREEPPRREIGARARANHDLDEIVFDTKVEAQEVLEKLYNLINDYEVATIADFYSAVGVTSGFTDEKYGWENLQGSSVIRVRGGGYVLGLPRPVQLD